MSQLKITLLGTGTSQGIPVIGCGCATCQSTDPRDKRLRTAATAVHHGTRVVFDIGPDFRQQMLANGIVDVDAILITHEHNDHISGIDDVRPINFIQKKNVPLWAMHRVQGEITRRFPYVFDEDSGYPGRPRLQMQTIEGPFVVGSMHILPIRVDHGPLPILGFRIGNFVYITDAKEIAGGEMDKLTGVHTLVLNALHRRPHFSHLNLREALDLIAEISPERTYLTHLSHDMGLHAEVEKELPAGVHLGYDGLMLEVPHL